MQLATVPSKICSGFDPLPSGGWLAAIRSDSPIHFYSAMLMRPHDPTSGEFRETLVKECCAGSRVNLAKQRTLIVDDRPSSDLFVRVEKPARDRVRRVNPLLL